MKKIKIKGRKKDPSFDLFKQAMAILDGKTLKLWKKEFNISAPEYYKLQSILACYELWKITNHQSPFPEILKSYLPDAIKKMLSEFSILYQVMGIFLNEVKKAEKEKNTLFLNTIKKVLKKDAEFYINSYQKDKGDNIKLNTLKKRWKIFTKWLSNRYNGLNALYLPRTFYQREKLTGLCGLAYRIHSIFTEPIKKMEDELQRERAIFKMRLLAEKYLIKPSDVFPPTNINPAEKEREIDVRDALNQYFKHHEEIDSQLEKLKDV